MKCRYSGFFKISDGSEHQCSNTVKCLQRDLKAATLRVRGLRDLIGKLELFVGVYDGHVLDKERAIKLIREATKTPSGS